jgi:hypothetical protein
LVMYRRTLQGIWPMTPRAFFESVVKPNAHALFEDFVDERLAINAICSLDAFFGQLYTELVRRNDPSIARFDSDDKYRDDLASRFPPYWIIRDTSAAIKHGELKRKKARLVKSSDQITKFVPGCGVFMCGHDQLGGAAVFIQMSDSYDRPEFVVGQVIKIAEDELTEHGL